MTISLKDLHAHVAEKMKNKIPEGMKLFGYEPNTYIGGQHAGISLRQRPTAGGRIRAAWTAGTPSVFPDAIRQAIAGAKSHIDILNMQEPNDLYDPDDRELPKPGFLTAVAEGLKLLADQDRKVTVRILLGKVLGQITGRNPRHRQHRAGAQEGNREVGAPLPRHLGRRDLLENQFMEPRQARRRGTATRSSPADTISGRRSISARRRSSISA